MFRFRAPARAAPTRSAGLRFQTRLTLFAALVGVVVVGCTLTATFIALRGAVADRVRDELTVAGRLFDELMSVRQRQLLQSAAVLTDDFGFREAVGIGEPDTIRSALINHSARIGADAAFLLDLDGKIVTRTAEAGSRHFAFRNLFERAVKEGYAASAVTLGNAAYQLVLLPVRAPIAVAWVALGFRIDDDTARRFHSLTGAEVTFFAMQSPNTVYASSRVGDTSVQRTAAGAPGIVRRDASGHYLSLTEPRGVSSSVGVVLQLSLDEALAPFRSLYIQLAFIGGGAIALALLGAALLARSVTRPIHYLAAAARRIAAGNYRKPVRIARQDELGTLGAAFNHMQTALDEREAQIRYQAQHDALTDLPNRAFAEHRLVEYLHDTRTVDGGVAVIMLGLNHFKAVNDVYGHAAGDQVLQHISRGLTRRLGPHDLLARIGPAHFLVMTPGADATGARALGERLIDFVLTPVPVGVGTVELTASIGIALSPSHGDEAETLLRRADITLYDAKEAGETVRVYESGRDEKHLRNLSLIADLRRATQNDELVLYFQPKQFLQDPSCLHAEVLLRWNHPEHGLLGPDEFIPLAEQAGQIGAVTHWVLDHALQQLAAWRTRGHGLHLSVNLSAVDLIDPDLPVHVEQLLRRHGVPPCYLTLEVTETAVVQDEARAIAALGALRACGVRLSIDDFGVGHSSLAQLKNLPVDELKIDKAFIFPLDRSEKDAMIVRSIIELGHNLGLEVVAEGVETVAIRNRLRRQECDAIQGYLLSRPLEWGAFSDWYARHHEIA